MWKRFVRLIIKGVILLFPPYFAICLPSSKCCNMQSEISVYSWPAQVLAFLNQLDGVINKIISMYYHWINDVSTVFSVHLYVQYVSLWLTIPITAIKCQHWFYTQQKCPRLMLLLLRSSIVVLVFSGWPLVAPVGNLDLNSWSHDCCRWKCSEITC